MTFDPRRPVQAMKIEAASRLKARELRFRAEMHMMAKRLAAMRGGALTPIEYRSIVVNRVTKLAHRLMPEAELYRRSLGVFPTIVRESLEALPEVISRVAAAADTCAPEEAPDDGTAWADDESDPVDAQWYFDMPSVQRLLSALPTGARSVLALGVPSLCGAAVRIMDDVRVLDRSKVLERRSLGLTGPAADGALEVVEWDLDAKPYQDATGMDVIVMDPPWYLDHYRAWLHTAVEACRIGGTICVVLPQVLTNRRSVVDRRELLAILRSIGHVSLKPDLLSYVTPSFERAVLDAKGIGHLGRWRRADLALVRVRHKRLPYEFEPVPDNEWKYREIGGRIVRSLWERTGEQGMPVIDPADAATGYRLSSVSRFYLRSSGVNLITSRGGAAVVSHWGRLPVILDLLGDGQPPSAAVKTALPAEAARDQDELAATLELLLHPHGAVSTVGAEAGAL
jgi:hypothetical protein